MRLEPQIFLGQILVNQCFLQRLIADFHGRSHLSGLGPTGMPPALLSINHYTSYSEKIQCTVAILSQKLRDTQRIWLRLNLHQFWY